MASGIAAAGRGPTGMSGGLMAGRTPPIAGSMAVTGSVSRTVFMVPRP